MALPVVNGAMTMCSFGMAPSTLIVTPEKRTLVENMPAATIMDNKPFANVLPFGLCTSLANPITASQTAAALGVLTPARARQCSSHHGCQAHPRPSSARCRCSIRCASACARTAG